MDEEPYLFVLGAILEHFVAFGVMIDKFGLPSFVNLDNFLFCLRIVTFVIFAGTVYLGLKANQSYKLYHSISDEDEERADELNMKMYRNLEYAIIMFNIAVIDSFKFRIRFWCCLLRRECDHVRINI